jgi:hypothetical protein
VGQDFVPQPLWYIPDYDPWVKSIHTSHSIYIIQNIFNNRQLSYLYLDTTASQPVLHGTHQTHCRHYPGFRLYRCHRSGRRAPASKCDEPLRWCRCQCPSLQDSYPGPNPVWDVPFSQEEVQARGEWHSMMASLLHKTNGLQCVKHGYCANKIRCGGFL